VRAAAAFGVGVLGLIVARGVGAEPDRAPIQYGDGVGCGHHVQLFTAGGSDPTGNGRPTGFFPGGSPPATNHSDCEARCGPWADSSIVKALAAGSRKNLAVTTVTGTCYLRRRPLGPLQPID
jgi:hypothetical protein